MEIHLHVHVPAIFLLLYTPLSNNYCKSDRKKFDLQRIKGCHEALKNMATQTFHNKSAHGFTLCKLKNVDCQLWLFLELMVIIFGTLNGPLKDPESLKILVQIEICWQLKAYPCSQLVSLDKKTLLHVMSPRCTQYCSKLLFVHLHVVNLRLY